MIRESPTRPWILRTGQGWKIKLFWTLMLLTGGELCLFVARVNGFGSRALPGVFPLAFLFVASGAIALGWLVLSIRCGGCGGKVAADLVRRSDVGRWWLDLVTLSKCPICGAPDGS